MRTLIPLKLYSTSHCHLCEQAQLVIESMQLEKQLTIIDIAVDDHLLSRYGTHIPVLVREDSTVELNWPFGEKEITQFLQT